MSSSMIPRPKVESGTPSSSFGSSPGNGGDASGGNMEISSRFFPCEILDHVRLGDNVFDTVKGKIKVASKIIEKHGRKHIFKQVFGVRQGEELLKASQCYLSTTAGRIAGLLFISTEKVAFCSERSITSNNPGGQYTNGDDQILIPLRNIRRTNLNEPQQKYIQILREDNSEFLFKGFVRYEKARRNLQTAISQTNSS